MEADFLNELNYQRNAIQLKYVELLEVKFKNYGKNELDDLPFSLHRGAEIENNYVNIYLTANIGNQSDTGFDMEIKVKGMVFALTAELEMDQLKAYALQHVVPMLLPYVREVSSGLISRTDLPKFILPTLDVINYLREQEINE